MSAIPPRLRDIVCFEHAALNREANKYCAYGAGVERVLS